MSSKNTVIPRLLRCKTTLPDPQVSSTCSNWVGSFILELLGRFELPTSSLPTAVEPSNPCCTRLFGGFLSKKDEVTACLFHCFHPRVSPFGSRCGSESLQLIKKRRQNIKYDRADDCPVRILIMMHQPVPQSCDLHPRDIRILLLEVF